MSKSLEKVSLKVKVAEVIDLANALNQLNSYTEKVGTQVVQLPFLFPLQTKLNIAKNQRVLRTAVEDYEKTHNGLIEQYFPTRKERLNETQKIEFDAKHKELQDALVELDLIKLERNVIVADNSPLSTNVWLSLEKIFDEPL